MKHKIMGALQLRFRCPKTLRLRLADDKAPTLLCGGYFLSIGKSWLNRIRTLDLLPSSMPDPLLSDLCAIWSVPSRCSVTQADIQSHIHPHQYCCPRCAARTCSLPCAKRHKQWSQCNGIRDPSIYVKRSDLATPKGIDHDYNYLTSIERQIDNAERDAHERGFLLENHGSGKEGWKRQGLDGPRKGEMPTKAAIERCGVIVERAPEGMARRKQNATNWDKK